MVTDTAMDLDRVGRWARSSVPQRRSWQHHSWSRVQLSNLWCHRLLTIPLLAVIHRLPPTVATTTLHRLRLLMGAVITAAVIKLKPMDRGQLTDPRVTLTATAARAGIAHRLGMAHRLGRVMPAHATDW